MRLQTQYRCYSLPYQLLPSHPTFFRYFKKAEKEFCRSQKIVHKHATSTPLPRTHTHTLLLAFHVWKTSLKNAPKTIHQRLISQKPLISNAVKKGNLKKGTSWTR